eukprot:434421_1
MGELEYFGKLNELIIHNILMKERENGNIQFKPNELVKFNLVKPIIFKLFHNLKFLLIGTSYCYGGGVAEFEMDLFSLSPLLDLSPNLNCVVIRSRRQHITRVDKHNNVQDAQHIGPSWLGLYWKHYSSLLTKQYELQGWLITYKMIIEEQIHETVFKMYFDSVYIQNKRRRQEFVRPSVDLKHHGIEFV